MNTVVVWYHIEKGNKAEATAILRVKSGHGQTSTGEGLGHDSGMWIPFDVNYQLCHGAKYVTALVTRCYSARKSSGHKSHQNTWHSFNHITESGQAGSTGLDKIEKFQTFDVFGLVSQSQREE